jgi:hypothetical protein
MLFFVCIACTECLSLVDLSLMVKSGVQYSLWGGSVLNLGTETHRCGSCCVPAAPTYLTLLLSELSLAAPGDRNAPVVFSSASIPYAAGD